MGEPESVPKEATPEILTAGPIGSEGGAFRLLLVNCPRVSLTRRGRERRDIADGDGLISIVQIGGCGRRAQSSRAARVDAVHMVETVADAELVVSTELMIDLGEEIARCGPD